MRVDFNGNSDREQRVLAVLATYYEANEDGTAPNPRAFMDAHPEFATELAEFFALQHEIHDLAAPIRGPEPMQAILAPATEPGDSRAVDVPPNSGRLSIGDYDLLGEIARGGVGIVYRARQRSLNRPVAVKVLRDGPYALPADAERFRNEAESVAHLDHPNIVPIYEVGEEGGCSFFSMRLIVGGSLADRAEEYSADFRRAARLMAAVARAIHHAHERGILHRDLKPSNILIDDRGEPLVADFGLARWMDADRGLTRTGMVLGTPSYMAPEQAGGRKDAVTIATDVHGLGAILYFLLTGRPPYGGPTVLDILDGTHAGSPKPPSTIRRAVDRDLETICLRCLEPEPVGRYPSAAAVADDLERWLEGRPILARRAGQVERAWRLCRRRPRMVGLLVVAVALGFTTLAGLIAWTKGRQSIAALNREVQRSVRVLRGQEYARDVALAGRAWSDNHLARARELLDRHRPAPGEDDLRGFAWHYYDRLCRLGRPSLVGHRGEVYHAAFFPDGQVFATAGQDRTARLWDAASGELRATLTGHADELNWVSISPDGRILATASDDETVKLWDAGTGQVKATLTGHRDKVVAAIFTPEGRQMISCGRTGGVILWDLAALRELRRFAVNIGDLQAMDISPDGAMLAIAGNGALIWDLAAWKQRARLERRNGQARFVEYSRDGRAVVTAGRGEDIELWETRTWRCTAIFATREPDVLSVRFSPDGRTLTAVGSHGCIHRIDRTTGAREMIPTGQDYLWCVAGSPDGQTLATASRDSSVKLWDLRRDRGRITIDLPTATISSHGFSPPVVLDDTRARICSLGFSPDGASITVADNGGRVWTHEVRAGTLRAATIVGEGTGIHQAILARDARRLVTEGGGGKVEVWELPGGRLLNAFPPMSGGPLGISPDGRWIARAGGRGEVHLRDTLDSRGPKVLAGSDGRVVLVSLRGDTVAMFNWGMGVPQILDAASGQLRATTGPGSGHRDMINVQVFSPDGSILATGGSGGSIIFWQIAPVRPVLHISGPGNAVWSIAFSPDGRTLATGHDDHRVRLWDVATARELATLETHSGPVVQVLFSPDGRTLASCANSGADRSELFLWPATPRE